jgi:hypothetical protein
VDCNGDDTCTQITYEVENASGVDHVGTFVRYEAGPIRVVEGVADVTSPCSGDSVLGVDDDVICHERILRFNNNRSKTNRFTFEVMGRRDPITTSVVFRKGSKQESCTIVGIGLESGSSGNCVSSCGNFDEFQTVTKTEIYKFKDCYVQFEYDLTTGEVVSATQPSDPPSGAGCTVSDGPIDDLSLRINGFPTSDGVLEFGDGWVGEGDSSATWRFIAGRWYCIGTTCP